MSNLQTMLSFFEKYPEGKAVMYCRLITDKFDQQKALHALIKNMKFLEDLLIHKTLGSIHVIPISFVTIPQEDFSKLFHEFLYDTEKNRRRLLQKILVKHGEKVHDSFIWRMIRVLYDIHPHDYSS